ncbi:permease [Oryzifoliimicrobium ureilyticus]|uniref:permease n=1 Tax=Oryzifoliimicrobium ureilyticus TaxID=3113724 RepID=UPI0030764A3D
MSSILHPQVFAVIVFCVLTETGREVCFKRAALSGGTSMFFNPIALTGIVFWAVELLAWTYVLGHVALSIAFPIMASSYAAIALAGAVFFKETINLRHAFGILLVTAGVICVGATGL